MQALKEVRIGGLGLRLKQIQSSNSPIQMKPGPTQNDHMTSSVFDPHFNTRYPILEEDLK